MKRQLLILTLVSACSSAQFSSGTRKASEPEANEASEEAIPEEQTFPEGSDGVELCDEVILLPDEPTALVEVFNWTAKGPTAAYDQVMATPVVGPLNPTDTIPTIIAPAFQSCDYNAGGAYVYAIDGKTGAQKWVSDFLAVPSASAAIGNIDAGSENEVVVYGIDHKVHALGVDGKVKWSSTEIVMPGFRNFGGPVLADLEGDGEIEVIAPGKVLNGKDGTTKFTIDITASPNAAHIVADTDGLPGLEIVAFNGIIKADGTYLCQFESNIIFQGAARLRKTDSHATIVGRSGNAVVGYNGTNCQKLFTNDFPGGGGGPYNLADYDGDSILDFGAAGRLNFSTFKSDGLALWKMGTKDTSSASTGATTFDFNADGKNEVVYNDEDYLRIFDGSTGRVAFENKNSTGTLYEYPVIVDATGDGHANIIVGANDCFAYTNKSAKGIRVFRSPKNNWVGTRKIWNQHAYDPLLVGEAGELTGFDKEKIYKPWLKEAHLVGYRNNIPRYNAEKQCKPRSP